MKLGTTESCNKDVCGNDQMFIRDDDFVSHKCTTFNVVHFLNIVFTFF